MTDTIESEIARVVQSVNEWDDRTSPDDYPDHLLVTSEELADILRNFAAAISPAPAPNVRGIDIQRLQPGTLVQKIGGYPFQGAVVAAFETLDGNERFVVEATHEAYRGMLHIFNGGQLRVITEGSTE